MRLLLPPVGSILFSIFLAGISAQGLAPPVITKPTQATNHYFQRRDKVTLPCHAEGNKAISYKWTRDDKVVEAETTSTGQVLVGFDSRTGNLSFQSYDEKYDGIYRCIASVDGASSMSQAQQTFEKRMDSFKTVADVEVTRNEYDYLEMKCDNKGVIVGDPNDINYNWYFKTESKQVPLDKGRIFIDAKGNLHFTFVKYDDRTISDKSYRCGYSMAQMRTIIIGNNMVLKIPQKKTPQNIRPLFKYSNSGLKAEIGASAKLECFFTGYDMVTTTHIPDTKWFSSDKTEIKGSSKYVLSNNNRVLQINNVKAEDEKSYYCQGITSNLQSEKIEVKLDVVSPPIWTNAPTYQTKSEKESVTFYCEARSLQNETAPDTPVWYINGRKVDKSTDFNHYLFSPNKKSLTIKNLKKPDDIMCAQCTVTNQYGTIMGDACLNVLEPIVVEIKPPEIQEIEKGDTIELTVKANTDPYITALTYQWIVKNETYNTPNLPPFVTTDPRTDRKFINTSHLTQEEYDTLGGVYKCRIYHLHDSVIVTTDVRLKDVTPAPVTASASIDMWIIGLIIGIIFLVIVIAIIIFVICRKQQEGDYNVDKKETGAGLDPEKELRDKGFNDLSRPDYEDYDYPEKKPRGDLEYDDGPIGGDDESLGEYGDEEDTHFNEDGSFIGIYQKRENERQNHKTESTI